MGKIKTLKADVIVVGSGGAGIAAAHRASENGAKVFLVSKDPIACSDSKISEGIVTVRGSKSNKDTEEVLASNMRIGGDDIADPKLVNRFAQDSQSAYKWLLKQRTLPPVDAMQRPEVLPSPLGGHNLPRSIQHKNAGLDYAHGLWNACITAENLEYIEDAWFLDVIIDEEKPKEEEKDEEEEEDKDLPRGLEKEKRVKKRKRKVAGGLVYHASKGEFVVIFAPVVILACGGLSTLYFPNTDTMRGNTGDGYAIAARAGVSLVDMEQVQFIPFGITTPQYLEGIVCGEPASAGPLGVLRDKNDKIVMGELMVRTRAEVSAAIANTVAAGKGTENGGCYLDLTGNAEGESGELFVKMMKERIPGLLKSVRKAYGRDAAAFKEYWEVRPTAHFHMGGVQVRGDTCETSLPGLLAAGQVLGGLHGSNRLGSTSLAEGLVFGLRAGEVAANRALKRPVKKAVKEPSENAKEHALALLRKYRKSLGKKGENRVIDLVRELQKESWQHIGPARTRNGIESFQKILANIKIKLNNVEVSDELLWNQNLIDMIELENMALVADSIALSAKLRGETLGAHVRLDEKSATEKQKVGSASIVTQYENYAWSHKLLDRPPSPSSRRVADKLKKEASILLFKTLRKMPLKIRDPLLKKKYEEML